MTLSTNTTTNPNARDEATRSAERLSGRPTVAPRVDIFENASEILLLVDLPGVSREHLGIDLEKGQLTLHAERAPEESGTPLATEFGARAYHRVFAVPRGIDAERIAAELKDGVLTLHLPKSAALRPRKIEVTSG
jgi:HSP20 family protein